jgi:hypothetical protein
MNSREAKLVRRNGQDVIVLTGRRYLSSHNLQDLILRKTYLDSLEIPVSDPINRTILGNAIPTRRGYFKYKGEVEINNKELSVNLYFENTDLKLLEPLSWNGSYILIDLRAR